MANAIQGKLITSSGILLNRVKGEADGIAWQLQLDKDGASEFDPDAETESEVVSGA